MKILKIDALVLFSVRRLHKKNGVRYIALHFNINVHYRTLLILVYISLSLLSHKLNFLFIRL